MAITVNWATKIINIPKADTLLLSAGPPEVRSLDIDSFRLTLKDLEDDEEAMPFLRTHNHNPPVTVGGVTLARVVEIINGYTITFEDGQYAVNLVGANNNISDVANVNQVSIRSANSAGLTYSKQVEDSAFADSRVWIDTVNGLSGTGYPRGTPSDPVSNLADAMSIIEGRNLPKRIHLTGPLTTSASDDISDYDITSDAPNLGTLNVTAGTVTTNMVLCFLTATGELSGNVSLVGCIMPSSLTDFDGMIKDCGLAGTIDLGSSGAHDIIDSFSDSPGTIKPVLNCDDINDLNVQFRKWSGGIKITNYSGANNLMSIDLVSGSIELDSTCTAGVIVVRGIGNLVDNSGVGCTVNQDGLVRPDDVNLKLDNNFAISASRGQ